ncbi:MAG: PIN domain-containing protein [Propionibacteriaceae bacterium]|jgi:predicted nucleic acid-binding protein|nr:PIN domain-containing protein [Propionibacteriaceae bacterium]
MKAVLDTNVLISGQFALGDNYEVAVTSLSWAELRFGASRPGISAQERALRLSRLQQLILAFGDGLPFDDNAATSYAVVTELVLRAGRQVRGRAVDLLIASIAHSHGAALVTANQDDFAPLAPLMPIISPEPVAHA